MSNYKILNLPDNASKDDVKKAYRKLSKIYHPDINGGDSKKTAQFVKIKEAYEAIISGNTGINYPKNGYNTKQNTGYKSHYSYDKNIKESFEVINGYFLKNGNYVFNIKTSYIQGLYLVNKDYRSNLYYDLSSWDLKKPSYNDADIEISAKNLKNQNYVLEFRIIGWVSGNITYKKFKIKKPKSTISKIFDKVLGIFK